VSVRVELQAPPWATHLLSDLTDWNRRPLPVAEMAPFDLPDDAYFEYAYLDADGARRPDPANDRPRLNPWWPYACHLAGPDYAPHPLVSRADAPTRGRTLRLNIESEILGQTRPVLVYSPAGHAADSLPWIVVQDGKAYFGWGRVPRLLDLLLETGRVRPAHLVFIPPRERTRDYAFNPAYRRFVCDEVVPRVSERAPWNGEATAWGASLGGLLSAQLAWKRPDLFGRVVTQSGAFQFSSDMDYGRPFGGDEEFLRTVLEHPGDLPDLRWWLDCGTLEWLLPSNRNLHRELSARGARCELDLRHAGHNWVNWKNGLAAGLEFALET